MFDAGTDISILYKLILASLIDENPFQKQGSWLLTNRKIIIPNVHQVRHLKAKPLTFKHSFQYELPHFLSWKYYMFVFVAGALR